MNQGTESFAQQTSTQGRMAPFDELEIARQRQKILDMRTTKTSIPVAVENKFDCSPQASIHDSAARAQGDRPADYSITNGALMSGDTTYIESHWKNFDVEVDVQDSGLFLNDNGEATCDIQVEEELPWTGNLQGPFRLSVRELVYGRQRDFIQASTSKNAEYSLSVEKSSEFWEEDLLKAEVTSSERCTFETQAATPTTDTSSCNAGADVPEVEPFVWETDLLRSAPEPQCQKADGQGNAAGFGASRFAADARREEWRDQRDRNISFEPIFKEKQIPLRASAASTASAADGLLHERQYTNMDLRNVLCSSRMQQSTTLQQKLLRSQQSVEPLQTMIRQIACGPEQPEINELRKLFAQADLHKSHSSFDSGTEFNAFVRDLIHVGAGIAFTLAITAAILYS